MENKNCATCRFGHDGQAGLTNSCLGCCPKSGKYYCWMAKTDAQKLEDLYYNRNRLVGDISTGYTYLPTVDLKAKNFNDMLQRTINKTKELQEISCVWNGEKEEENKMEYNYPRVEGFCRHNNIKYELGSNCRSRATSFKFTKDNHSKRIIVTEESLLGLSNAKLENNIIHDLKKTFINKEENKMEYNFTKIEKFCKDNCIKYEIDFDCYSRLATFTFIKDSCKERKMFSEQFIKQYGDVNVFEYTIIEHLSNIFNIKEENKMEVKKTDYQRYYTQGSWRERIEIKDVKFNGPCTIVFWTDGDKTIVKCTDEEFDMEKGLAMAIAKKFLGTNKTKSNYCNIFKKFIPEEDNIIEEEDFEDGDFMNPPVEEKEEKIFSIMEYAKYFGVSEWKVRQMIKNGELNASKNKSGYWKITV